ncbi:MAG: transposase domain-containing protein [Oscillospiraceae bacterium]|nr:transposase domain-containing protein [Oscillospiraceae bacterium]
METAKANGIDPYHYLFYTLSVLPYFGKSPSHERLETLMPWADEVQQRYNEKFQIESE